MSGAIGTMKEQVVVQSSKCRGGAREVVVPFFCLVIMAFFETSEQRSEGRGKEQAFGYVGRGFHEEKWAEAKTLSGSVLAWGKELEVGVVRTVHY